MLSWELGAGGWRSNFRVRFRRKVGEGSSSTQSSSSLRAAVLGGGGGGALEFEFGGVGVELVESYVFWVVEAGGFKFEVDFEVVERRAAGVEFRNVIFWEDVRVVRVRVQVCRKALGGFEFEFGGVEFKFEFVESCFYWGWGGSSSSSSPSKGVAVQVQARVRERQFFGSSNSSFGRVIMPEQQPCITIHSTDT